MSSRSARCLAVLSLQVAAVRTEMANHLYGVQVGTTVSPTYAAEVSGHPSVAPHMNKFFGIINGIDMDIWDPQSDQFLPK